MDTAYRMLTGQYPAHMTFPGQVVLCNTYYARADLVYALVERFVESVQASRSVIIKTVIVRMPNVSQHRKCKHAQMTQMMTRCLLTATR